MQVLNYRLSKLLPDMHYPTLFLLFPEDYEENSFACFPGARKVINSELWHACAGPLVSLPQPGSLVYYFPQGHSEQVESIDSYSLHAKCYSQRKFLRMHSSSTFSYCSCVIIQPKNRCFLISYVRSSVIAALKHHYRGL